MNRSTVAAGSAAVKSRLFQSAVLGAGVWLLTPLAGWSFRLGPAWPESLAVVILLLSPLVLVPLGLRLSATREDHNGPRWLWSVTAVAQLPAALLLCLAFALPPGIWAAAMTLPWLLYSLAPAMVSLRRLKRLGLFPLPEFCTDMGPIFLVVGAGWALLSRYGARPLDFDPMIVLLTAAHFHFTGFVLPLLAGWAGTELKGGLSNTAAVGVVAGVPLVAAGITLSQLGWHWLEGPAAWFLSVACVGVAVLQIRLARGCSSWASSSCFWISSLSLLAGMSLAAAYGARQYVGLAWLNIPVMLISHATLNGIGFCLMGLAAWIFRLTSHR